MARSRQPNGVIDTLTRLFGHHDHRSILTKYVSEGVFNKHLQDGETRVFKRSTECDNLIRNVLALDEVLRRQDLVIKAAKGTIPKKDALQHLAKEKEKLEAKFKAYGYWLNRMPSLSSTLESGFDLESSALEDVLSVDGSAGIISTSSPYALRAVRLLEKIEEEGRLSKVTPDQLVEKAWAIYRLGLDKQAVTLAREATELDKENADGWLLLAVDAQDRQLKATSNASRYAFEKEIAEPISSHERWAEEMQSDAVGEYFKAQREEKGILFAALKNWPLDSESRNSGFKLPGRRNSVRDQCIGWLFSLLEPYNNYASGSIDLRKAYEMNGLAPEFQLKESLSSIRAYECGDYPAHSLTEQEQNVAEMICHEFDLERGQMFNALDPNCYKLQLMLLHVRYALKIDGYEQARLWFIDQLRHIRAQDLKLFIGNANLFNALITHLSMEGLANLKEHLSAITQKLQNDQRDERTYLELNLQRKVYDHAIARGKFNECVQVAREARSTATSLGGRAPQDRLCCIAGISRNTLTAKFWHYLEILAACQVKPSNSTCRLISDILLSVAKPDVYFANEKDYMIGYADEFMGWYEPAYGDSIITNGEWLRAISRMVQTGWLTAEEASRAEQISRRLKKLMDSKGY